MQLPPCCAIFYCPTENPSVSVTTPAHTVLNILQPWFAQKSHTLHAFSAGKASYEEWLNWELFDAFLQHGYHCEGRPSYQQLGDHPLKSLKGDLLATHPDTQEKYLIEVALVGAGTQDKWREKYSVTIKNCSNCNGAMPAKNSTAFSWCSWSPAISRIWCKPGIIGCK